MMQALKTQIDDMTHPVNLHRAPPNHVVREELPFGAEAWLADYAWLLLWPVTDGTVAGLDNASAAVEEHLARTFPPRPTRPGRVIDGYALLVLSTVPDEALRSAIGQVQIQRRLCRRIVLWPEKEIWRGLEAVPCLALPPAAANVAAPDAVLLSPEEQALREALFAEGVKPVVDAHIAELGEEA